MDTSILEDIGLTGAEIKVFIALLELGSSTAGNIVQHSRLQNAVVHRAFHSLAEKGLMTYVYQGKIKAYQAVEPRNARKHCNSHEALQCRVLSCVFSQLGWHPLSGQRQRRLLSDLVEPGDARIHHLARRAQQLYLLPRGV